MDNCLNSKFFEKSNDPFEFIPDLEENDTTLDQTIMDNFENSYQSIILKQKTVDKMRRKENNQENKMSNKLEIARLNTMRKDNINTNTEIKEMIDQGNKMNIEALKMNNEKLMNGLEGMFSKLISTISGKNQRTNENINNKNYNCKKCEYKTDIMDELDYHDRISHKRISTYNCK